MARLVCLVPACGLPGIGKVCWNKILLGDCAGVKVAAYCRNAILVQAMPEPEPPDVATLPAWLLHFLIFVTRGKTRPV